MRSVGAAGTSALLQQEVPRIVKAASRQLKEKSVKTRVAAFHCLRQLVSTLPGCLAEHAASLVPGVDKALKDASSNNLRTAARSKTAHAAAPWLGRAATFGRA